MKINLQNSLILLNLNNNYNLCNINNLSLEELKKAYHIAALNSHPDKNINENAKQKFQDVNSAYNYLKKYLDNNENCHIIDDDIVDNNKNLEQSSYINLINSFLDLLIKNIRNDVNNKSNVLNFQEQCINCSLEIFDKLVTNLNIIVLEDIYNYINNYENIGNYRSIIDKLKVIIKKNLESYNIYILNPTIKNILNSEIYKLEIDNNIICIPLWHNELNYENNIIKIEPLLDYNIKIDKCNNIHYYYKNTYENIIKKLRDSQNIIINIACNIYEIPLCKLKLVEKQHYFFPNKGIPLINSDNIFDNSKNGSVIVEIFLE